MTFPIVLYKCSLQNLHQTSESNTYLLLSKSQRHRGGLPDNTKNPAVVSPERSLPIEEHNGTYTVWKEAVVPLNVTSVKADANGLGCSVGASYLGCLSCHTHLIACGPSYLSISSCVWEKLAEVLTFIFLLIKYFLLFHFNQNLLHMPCAAGICCKMRVLWLFNHDEANREDHHWKQSYS